MYKRLKETYQSKVIENEEIYEKDDKFYPNQKISLKKKNKFIKILKFQHNMFSKYDITYSIYYGTLLGYARNKKIIPYDNDVDTIIGKNNFKKLISLAEDINIKNIMYNEDIYKYKPDFSTDNIFLVLNKSVLNNKGYGIRYNCKGDQVKSQIDSCSFNGPIGRFIIGGKTHSDIFIDGNEEYPKTIDDMFFINKEDVIESKLDGETISVFKDNIVKKRLEKLYGKDYMSVPKKYLN